MSAHQKLVDDLAAKAHRLRESPLFVHPCDDVALFEKQLIFLVLAGAKPLTAVASGHWEPTPTGRRTVADDPEAVGKFLDSFGLAYSLSQGEEKHATLAVVTLHADLLKGYERGHAHGIEAHDVYAGAGRLFGFPETAVKAFVEGNCLPLDEQRRVEQQAGLGNYPVGFRLSRSHWQEEMAVVKERYEFLHSYGLIDP